MDSMKKAQEIAKQAEVINKELMGTVVVGSGNTFWNYHTILYIRKFFTFPANNFPDPSQQVYATFNGLGMPVGIKVSDALAAQGGEAVSLACSQAMLDGHTKSQNTSEPYQLW